MGVELSAVITRENALETLQNVPCPYCSVSGRFCLFREINNNGVGIICDACSQHHPFVKQRVMWLRGEQSPNRRSNDIIAVTKECGAYCYICGVAFAELRARGIGSSVHHTKPFAEHGETGKKIPVCTECHELANFMQRMRQRQRK